MYGAEHQKQNSDNILFVGKEDNSKLYPLKLALFWTQQDYICIFAVDATHVFV